ncbi:MAG: translation initiation factor [Thermacetogenium sp.]|jgi:translation initiation factor IF-2|nr:translation initiation factor [Thermacetogenium sp.]
MARIRVHELAKELKINSKELIARLRQMGYAVKNHMSTLDERDVLKIKKSLTTPHVETKNARQPQQKSAKKVELKENDFRKRALARKEEQRQRKEQNQRKILAKVAAHPHHSRGRKKRRDASRHTDEMGAERKKIVIGDQITVQELANILHVSGSEVITKLIALGVMASLNQLIDSDTATLVAAEFGVDVEVRDDSQELEALLEDVPDKPEDLEPRPPVITVMGHVDHGKTSLLDYIRHTNVTATEAGGITQHIGAYQIEVRGKKITFLDTPGHEAFTAMRARGAQVTDIAVLVVAADDGVMPQTVEAINHAKAAGVPIVVAINKIDKPGANAERVKQQLAEHGIVPEEWGGDNICVPVSAKTGAGIDQLLEMLLLVAEMEELKANPNCPARGTVIEAQLDKGRGPVATVLIQKGTLKVGDIILAGTACGKVRAMQDYKGRRIKKASPGTPVEILGLSEVPEAGDLFYVVKDEKLARQIVEKRQEKKRLSESAGPDKVTLEDLFKQIQEGKVKELNLVVKADVQGSVEALIQALSKLSTDEVRINIIHSGVGAVTETDVMLASASNALVIGFNVRPDANAKKTAESQQVEIRLYRVIYEAIDDVKAALEGLLEPIYKEVPVGRAEVREIFHIPKVGVVAGCYVSEGKVIRNGKVRVVREGVVIYDGTIASLKRFKDDAREVVQGHECGIGLDRFQDLKPGDILEGYQIEELKRELKPL